MASHKRSRHSSKRSAKRSRRSVGGKSSKRSTHSVANSSKRSSKRSASKRDTKSYARIDSHGKEIGHYTGSSPEIAGKNAGKMIIRDSNYKTTHTTVTIKQKSYGPTRNKEFTYKVTAVKLKTPRKNKFPGGKVVVSYYDYQVERVW